MEHRRPKAGDAPHEGLLKVETREFRCLDVQEFQVFQVLRRLLRRRWDWTVRTTSVSMDHLAPSFALPDPMCDTTVIGPQI